MQSHIDLSKVLQNGTDLRLQTGRHNPQKKHALEITQAFANWLMKSGLSLKIEQYSSQKRSAESDLTQDSE